MKKILVKCPDEAEIISVVIMGRDGDVLFGNQELYDADDGLVITVNKPTEEECKND